MAPYALLALLTAATPAIDTVVAPPKTHAHFDALAVPLVNYSTDFGMGLGAAGALFFYDDGYRPYRHALSFQTFFTTRGVQMHWLRYDGPRLFGRARVEARIEYRRELGAPYFGAGNASAPDFDGAPEDPRYRYGIVAPSAWARLRGAPLGEHHPLQLYAGYAFRWMAVHAGPDALLAQQGPLGRTGGLAGQLWLGALWETRDDEVASTRGGLEEIALRVAARPTLSDFSYAGLTLSSRRFFSLGTPRLVLAQRITLDALFGNVPFFEWTQTGGLFGLEGVGGMTSVRGIYRARYGGNFKAISNTELRFMAAEFRFLGAPLGLGALAFFDIGRAWQPGGPDGDGRWHAGVGGGVRLVRRALVVRFDAGFGVTERSSGFYLTIGHLF